MAHYGLIFMTGVALLAISGAERGIDRTAAQSRPPALRVNISCKVYFGLQPYYLTHVLFPSKSSAVGMEKVVEPEKVRKVLPCQLLL